MSSEQSNYETFRDSLSIQVVSKLATGIKTRKTRARSRKKSDGRHKGTESGSTDANSEGSEAEEFAEFVDVAAPFLTVWMLCSRFVQYLSTEIFTSLPDELRTLSYSAVYNDLELDAKYSDPLSLDTLSSLIDTLPPSVSDSLTSYALISTPGDLSSFLLPIFTSYITSTTLPPPPWQSTRSTSCELCSRSWIPLTYHHLIPRGVHAKALKRGWAEEWELNKVAWLCRACHSFVHRVATNEDLAREWSSVERLLAREDVKEFVTWVGRVRWKAR